MRLLVIASMCLALIAGCASDDVSARLATDPVFAVGYADTECPGPAPEKLIDLSDTYRDMSDAFTNNESPGSVFYAFRTFERDWKSKLAAGAAKNDFLYWKGLHKSSQELEQSPRQFFSDHPHVLRVKQMAKYYARTPETAGYAAAMAAFETRMVKCHSAYRDAYFVRRADSFRKAAEAQDAARIDTFIQTAGLEEMASRSLALASLYSELSSISATKRAAEDAAYAADRNEQIARQMAERAEVARLARAEQERLASKGNRLAALKPLPVGPSALDVVNAIRTEHFLLNPQYVDAGPFGVRATNPLLPTWSNVAREYDVEDLKCSRQGSNIYACSYTLIRDWTTDKYDESRMMASFETILNLVTEQFTGADQVRQVFEHQDQFRLADGKWRSSTWAAALKKAAEEEAARAAAASSTIVKNCSPQSEFQFFGRGMVGYWPTPTALSGNC